MSERTNEIANKQQRKLLRDTRTKRKIFTQSVAARESRSRIHNTIGVTRKDAKEWYEWLGRMNEKIERETKKIALKKRRSRYERRAPEYCDTCVFEAFAVKRYTVCALYWRRARDNKKTRCSPGETRKNDGNFLPTLHERTCTLCITRMHVCGEVFTLGEWTKERKKRTERRHLLGQRRTLRDERKLDRGTNED